MVAAHHGAGRATRSLRREKRSRAKKCRISVSCKNIRLSADRLTLSAEVGISGRMVMVGRLAPDAGVAQRLRCDGLHGWKRALARIVKRSHLDWPKPVRCAFRFNRDTGL